MMRRPTTLAVLGIAVGLFLVSATPSMAQGDVDPVRARAFRVEYKPLGDAADVVAPLLSSEGTLTMRLRMQVLVVEDRQSVLNRVAQLLESFDLPPQNVEVTFSLLLGTDRRDKPESPASPSSVFSDDVKGVIDALRNFTKWTDYERLGSQMVVGAEGQRVVADLSEEYRVIFTVGTVSRRKGTEVVKFDSIALQRLTEDADGVKQAQDLHSTGAILQTGRLSVVGAATSAGAKRALFLAMQVEAR